MAKSKKIKKRHYPSREFLKYVGPGLLVTVGFIDPGNWASNVAAGSEYGYQLLWMVTLSTFMLIVLQHNAAHLGIATGYCLSESATIFLKPWISKTVLTTAMLAAISTAMAEILGGAIALKMLFHVPIKIGSVLVLFFIMWILFTNSYHKLEKIIMGFVSLVGISFLIEVSMVEVPWASTAVDFVAPAFPSGSLLVIMSVLGAVVMPHNLFLHSEVIQSRQWNLEDEQVIEKQLKFEFLDTLFSMLIGWAINSAMIIVAAATFYKNGIIVTEIEQAQQMLTPLLGNAASILFALALLFAGISSSITAGMAGGSIYAGIFKEPYDMKQPHSRIGVMITLIVATLLIFFISDPFQGLIYSQMFLSIQLPISIFLQVYLTSSKKVMKQYANALPTKILLIVIGMVVTILNIMLLIRSF